MDSDAYDDPDTLNNWCQDQRKIVADCLQSQKVNHGRIGDWPAWQLAPYVSVWAIESLAHPERIGWWAIAGDLPTDYISSSSVSPPQHPRKAVRMIAKRWMELVRAWKDGRELEDFQIGTPEMRDELAPLLESRADLLLEFTEDESYWE